MTLPFEPTVIALVLAVFAAFVIGVSKTSVGGVAVLAVAIFGQLMPAKESTAAVLLLLIIGDVIGVISYHKHADWGLLKKLLPAVLPGIALGALFVHFVPDIGLKRFIGVILVVMLVLQLWSRRKPVQVSEGVKEMHPAATISTGVAAGFTTMTANAAGPVMSLYLLAARVDKVRFLGTGAYALNLGSANCLCSRREGFSHYRRAYKRSGRDSSERELTETHYCAPFYRSALHSKMLSTQSHH